LLQLLQLCNNNSYNNNISKLPQKRKTRGIEGLRQNATLKSISGFGSNQNAENQHVASVTLTAAAATRHSGRQMAVVCVISVSVSTSTPLFFVYFYICFKYF